MKQRILLLAVLAAILLLLFGSLVQAQVVVNPDRTVTIDGQSAGALTDALVNHPGRRVEILAALDSYINAQGAAKDATISAKSAQIQQLQADLAAVTQLRDNAATAYESLRPQLVLLATAAGVNPQQQNQMLATLDGLLQVAKTPAEVAKLEELRRQKAEADARAAALAAEVAAQEAKVNQQQ